MDAPTEKPRQIMIIATYYFRQISFCLVAEVIKLFKMFDQKNKFIR